MHRAAVDGSKGLRDRDEYKAEEIKSREEQRLAAKDRDKARREAQLAEIDREKAKRYAAAEQNELGASKKKNLTRERYEKKKKNPMYAHN